MSQRDAIYRAVCSHPHDDTPRMVLADYLVNDAGEPALAEFIRVQIAVCEAELDVVNIHPRQEKDALIALNLLRDRERELFASHGAEWCKDLPGTMKYRLEDGRIGIDTTEGIAYEFVRGFPSHWYGPWSVWVGGECATCEGAGNRVHTKCCTDGRIPGACHRAWKPSWAMTCEACGGVKGKHCGANGQPRCPRCGNSQQNGIPHGSPELRRCASCKTVWEPEVCPTCHGTGRVPVPIPRDALPITDVTLTTRPELRYGRDAVGNAIAVLPVGRVEHSAEYDGKPTSEVARELLAAEWPGITFHLPQGAMR